MEDFKIEDIKHKVSTKTKQSDGSNIDTQILGEQVPNGESNDNDYESYGVNLALQDASRINLIDYTNLKTITQDTDVLSAFLSVPV